MVTVEIRNCAKHGMTDFSLHKDKTNPKGRWRCKACQRVYTSDMKLKIKLALVKEFGGKCQRCGYDKFYGALEFHHRDSSAKEATIAMMRSLPKARLEAQKCDLLCANCHREIEAEVRACPS